MSPPKFNPQKAALHVHYTQLQDSCFGVPINLNVSQFAMVLPAACNRGLPFCLSHSMYSLDQLYFLGQVGGLGAAHLNEP